MRPFFLLCGIDCDKIYVAGNHDDSLGELEAKVNHETLNTGTRFDIRDRHYPKRDKKSDIKSGVKVGIRSYFFLHGHQFDKQQAIFRYVSKLIGKLWDPLDLFQNLFNITFTKKHWNRNFMIFFGLLFGGKYFLWNALLKSSFWGTMVWAIFTGFFALSSIPGIVVHTQRSIYNSKKPIYKTAEKVITAGYYQAINDTIDAELLFLVIPILQAPMNSYQKQGKNYSLIADAGLGQIQN